MYVYMYKDWCVASCNVFVLSLTDSDDCLDVTCSNRGICRDAVAGYTCQCVFGYTGENCESSRSRHPRKLPVHFML